MSPFLIVSDVPSSIAPDALAVEFAKRGAPFSNPLQDTNDGLRGFEITDPDGYILFFGCPKER